MRPRSRAIHALHNFVRIHKTLRVAPAMAAGVSDRPWDVSDIVALVEARESPPAKRGSYMKREKRGAHGVALSLFYHVTR